MKYFWKIVYWKKFRELKNITKEKHVVIKAQKYEEAYILRDKEKKIINFFNNKLI